jgi:release factor glutamine methyltransferase
MQKLNRSFSRRIGKSLSTLQQTLISNELSKYLLDPTRVNPSENYIAEIGIGMGDHFISRAVHRSNYTHIGFDPYLNGIANSLKLIQVHEINNVLLWPDDMDLVFDKLPDSFIDELYILFPDPWPKTRHHKKRLLNPERLKLFTQKLKKNGTLFFTTDIEGYFTQSIEIISDSNLFLDVHISDLPYAGYTQTKYHQKAINEGRQVKFLHAKRK